MGVCVAREKTCRSQQVACWVLQAEQLSTSLAIQTRGRKLLLQDYSKVSADEILIRPKNNLHVEVVDCWLPNALWPQVPEHWTLDEIGLFIKATFYISQMDETQYCWRMNKIMYENIIHLEQNKPSNAQT